MEAEKTDEKDDEAERGQGVKYVLYSVSGVFGWHFCVWMIK